MSKKKSPKTKKKNKEKEEEKNKKKSTKKKVKEKAEKGKVEEGKVEISPYEAMDLADEEQIVDELEGRLTKEDMKSFVYSFKDSNGREVTGLSWKGVKATWWELNNRGTTKMTITDKVRITQGNGYVDVAVYAKDEKRGIGTWGMARGYTQMKTRKGKVRDRFPSAKAMSKAQRNALRHLFPSEMVASIIKEFIDKGYVKKLSPKSSHKTKRKLYKGSQKFSQKQLMKKYGMNLKQVPPNCPNCGAKMYIRERKDKTGLFWACPNYYEKKCKAYDVDDVDIKGTITMKRGK